MMRGALVSPFQLPIRQVDLLTVDRSTLPTMYDLPSEDPEESGLPDEFHDLQPQLLSATFRLIDYTSNDIFTGTDLNLYYDLKHPLWHKRPDWFAAVGVDRLYQQSDLRMSYVIWQEQVSPAVVVELLSPGTEAEDLGVTIRNPNEPPTKWEVYEQILQVPYYVVFDRYRDRLRAFVLESDGYQEHPLPEQKLWIPQLKIGLGLWHGKHQGITRNWLRWYDEQSNWIPTPVEAESQRAETESQRAETESQRAETESQRANQLATQVEALRQKLQDLGIDPDTVS